MKIMFSIQFGDSLAHVFRTRTIAKKLIEDGYDVKYVVSHRAFKYLNGFVKQSNLVDNNQSYGFSRLASIDNLRTRFIKRVYTEYHYYKYYKPDIIIGDMGLASYVYCTETPLIKIINNIFLDIASIKKSSFTVNQRKIIIDQIEDLINSARKSLAINKPFEFKDFFDEGWTIINGDPRFLTFKKNNFFNPGVKLEIKIPSYNFPDKKIVFINMGTGTGIHKEKNIKKILDIVSCYFKKIYISTGYSNGKFNLNNSKIISYPFFNEFPNDVGSIVCHGGYGAVHLGLFLGLPTHILPFHIEHYSNGERLVKIARAKNYGTLPLIDFSGIDQKVSLRWKEFAKGSDFSLPQILFTGAKIATNNDYYNYIKEKLMCI